MARTHLRTLDVARAVGVHPNTVRLYEAWGFLPAIPRSPTGYRLYTEDHVDQMRLARLALHGGWPGRNIRQSALSLVRCSAAGNLKDALEQAHQHLGLVHAERAQAELAAEYLQRWADGESIQMVGKPLQIRAAARLLALTPDILRNWERSGLLHVPRDASSGYRAYGPEEIGRLRVIRLLRYAGYSNMAILRMLLQLDQGKREALREILDTPRPDEDVLSAADHWLSTLAEQEQRARDIIAQVEAMLSKEAMR